MSSMYEICSDFSMISIKKELWMRLAMDRARSRLRSELEIIANFLCRFKHWPHFTKYLHIDWAHLLSNPAFYNFSVLMIPYSSKFNLYKSGFHKFDLNHHFCDSMLTFKRILQTKFAKNLKFDTNKTSRTCQGQCFACINPDAFAPGFKHRMQTLMDLARNSEPVLICFYGVSALHSQNHVRVLLENTFLNMPYNFFKFELVNRDLLFNFG